jgi:NADPH-dependent 2,4-dienoyl-CoA reductase/sulfur reductase-like enzyme
VGFDTVIIGAGPAGLAAARASQKSGQRTLVIDDNWSAGGQIWRGQAERAVPGVEFRFEQQVTDLNFNGRRIILACGARELFLPFPGWTLPHVVGAGGLQALVKAGLDVRQKKVVIAGTGPLLLAVAHNLRKAGANVILIAEQAPWSRLLPFGLALLRWPEKLWQSFTLADTSYSPGRWPVEAEPGSVTLSDGRKIACDYLACGFGLVPNLELPTLAGCKITNGFVQVDAYQRTSVDNIYAVGEITGIGGVEKAEAEGEAAGSGLQLQGNHSRFTKLLEQTFALRPELQSLPRPNTIVCRCEDVTWQNIAACRNRREAKLQRRCGMGPCQGRICGPALTFLKQWPEDSTRPPVLPVSTRHLIE